MNSLLLAALMFVGYIVAYYTYGRFLARRIFSINPAAVCPSRQFQDNIDFVPTQKHVLFGHHYTSIAGLGPIVGPAIGIIWGWLPAVLWVFFGSIVMGAVHDFGALIISLRHQGRSIGDIAADIINPRVRLLFLLIIFFLLLLVIAVFALIIALLFNLYPQAVIPVWSEIPIALVLGWWIYSKKGNAFIAGLIAVVVMYITIYIGALYPINVADYFTAMQLSNPDPSAVIFWIVMVLLFNAWLASILPVQTLLQPRDYINSHELIIAMALLTVGVFVAHPPLVAPMLNLSPQGAPPILPSLFIIIACGAISGFHCLVSSGTSAKQCASESDAQFIGYGSMMWEGALATLVIVAVAGGIGMGMHGQTGAAAFNQHYASWAAADGLSAKLDAFVYGSANMMEAYHIPKEFALAVMAVFIVSFAGTTVDSATRIQRYVIIELGKATKLTWLTRRQVATFIAVAAAAALAFSDGSGKGAMALWPLFGCLNQLLGGLALLVITIYLAHQGKPLLYTAVPMVFMIAMTGWAMVTGIQDFHQKQSWLLLVISVLVFALEIWMIIESAVCLRQACSKKQPALS